MVTDVDTRSAQPDPQEQRWDAVLARDPERDGEFVFAVTSTGIFCRPSCPARRPHRHNVRFYDLPRDAEADGFRACLRCKPTDLSQQQRRTAMIESACRRIDAAETEPPLAELAADAGLSPAHFQKLFKAQTGLSPKRYAMARRQEALRRELGRGGSVTDAIQRSGHQSAARVYERAVETLGMRPSDYRDGGPGQVIRYATTGTDLGIVLVAGTALGLCAVLFGEDEAALATELQERFPAADIRRAGAAWDELVATVVSELRRPSGALELPLDIQGTVFEQQVWEALRNVPRGQTATYTEIARTIGRPTATRAVAKACGANPLAVLVPCHRVLRSDGGLGGYRWGVARKRALLERESACESLDQDQGRGRASVPALLVSPGGSCMSDFVDHHPLSRDLPELKDSIHALKLESAHFAREFDEYEAIDKEIVRIEQGLELRSDDELETLKVQRVRLKDSLHAQAKAHAEA